MNATLSAALATVPVLLTLLGMVWKLASLATMLTETNRQYRDDLTEIRSSLEPLKGLPAMQQRLDTLEDATNALSAKVSDFPRTLDSKSELQRESLHNIERRLYRCETKLGLTPTGGVPRMGSKPDLGGGE